MLTDWTITPLPTEPFAVIVPPEMIAVPELTLTITGGTITAGDWGVYASKSTTTITGGTIKSTGGAIYNESGTLLEMLGQTGGNSALSFSATASTASQAHFPFSSKLQFSSSHLLPQARQVF